MGSIVIQGWTTSEIEEARSVITRPNNGGNSGYDGDGDRNKKDHGDIVSEHQKWFPLKTLDHVVNLYLNLIIGTSMVMPSSNKRDTDNIIQVDGHVTSLANGNTEMVEEEQIMLNNEGLLFDYPLEDIEMGNQTEQEVEIDVQNEVDVQAREALVTKEKEVEAPKIQTNCWHAASSTRRRVVWTKEEHRLFLEGMQEFGRGDWKNISRHFVTTRTAAQCSSHAQKYFLKLAAEGKAAPPAPKRRRFCYDWVAITGQQQAAAPAVAPVPTHGQWMHHPMSASGFNNVYDQRLCLPPQVTNPIFVPNHFAMPPLMYHHLPGGQPVLPFPVPAGAAVHGSGQRAFAPQLPWMNSSKSMN
uniref:Uncharacterized protein n=1 Tax=Leersia perrieri TaxID=77586 RepID=A0A0D9XJG3_9ORYZ